jgi:hypothetical protein
MCNRFPLDFLHLTHTHPELFRTKITYLGQSSLEPKFTSDLADSAPYSLQLPAVCTQISVALIQIWLRSGFSHNLTIRNERYNREKIRVYLQACPDYLHHITPEELQVIQIWWDSVEKSLSKN